MAGVGSVKIDTAHGWNRLAIVPTDRADVREDLFKLAARKGWSLREMRREVASLEDFFVKITAAQQDGDV